jgi:tagatose-6-phosphate ketose/aldose isomerase
MVTSLLSLVDLPVEQKQARGLLFTPAEIAQQPDTWLTTLSIFKQHRERIAAFLDSVGIRESLGKRPTVLLIGAGTSDYVARALEFLLRQRWQCNVSAVASTDLLPNMDAYVIPDENYLWISFSRSGDSPEGVAVIEHALRLHPSVAHLVVTCNADARMAALCEGIDRTCVVVLDDAVNDRSLAMTSSFTNMIVLGHCLAHTWSLEEYDPILDALVHAGRGLLESAAELAEQVATRGFMRVCFVGGGALASVAKESALKVLEMTAGKVKTMSETVLGLRHGPMAALDEDTLFVCFVDSDERRSRYAKDLLEEIGAKKVVAERIAIGPTDLEAEVSPHCERYLALDGTTPDMYRPALDVIFGQLVGLYCSVACGMRPDSPSPDGVINRVVQNFHIY